MIPINQLSTQNIKPVQWRIQDLPEGARTPDGVRQSIIWQNFADNMKMKEFGSRGEHVPNLWIHHCSKRAFWCFGVYNFSEKVTVKPIVENINFYSLMKQNFLDLFITSFCR